MKGKGRTCLEIHGDMDFLRLGKVYSIAIDDIQTVTICGCMPSTDCLILPRNSWTFFRSIKKQPHQLRGLFGPARGKSTAVSEIGIHSDLWRISTLSHKSRWVPRWLNGDQTLSPNVRGHLYNLWVRVTCSPSQKGHQQNCQVGMYRKSF